MAWIGLAIGIVMGGSSNDGGAGGSKGKGDSDNDTYQGLFSLFGHETWLYIGGILGFGEAAGVYLTAGPMIGKDMDFAVGGGLHIAKTIGLGVVVPLRQAYNAYEDNKDKIAAAYDTLRELALQAYHHVDVLYAKAHALEAHLPQIQGALEHIVNKI